MAVPAKAQATGPWDEPALARFREWEPAWVDQCLKMSADPWTSGVLPRKDVELISLAVNAACTNLSAEGTRRHIRGALEAGATREEILMILKIASLLSIHTCSLGAPILLEEAQAAGVKLAPKAPAATPVCDKMKAAGQWNTAWDGFFEIDPAWTEAIIAASLPGLHQRGIHAQAGGAAEHRRRCVDHSYVRARNTPAHPVGPEARRDDGGDHGSAQDLCRRGYAGEQSRCPHPGRGASTCSADERRKEIAGESTETHSIRAGSERIAQLVLDWTTSQSAGRDLPVSQTR